MGGMLVFSSVAGLGRDVGFFSFVAVLVLGEKGNDLILVLEG